MSKYGTRLADTEALMAALNQDESELDRIVESMTPAELRALADAAGLVALAAASARYIKTSKDGSR